MYVLWMIVVGLIVGAIAKLLMPGRDPGGIIVTILLGIGGSVERDYLVVRLAGMAKVSRSVLSPPCSERSYCLQSIA